MVDLDSPVLGRQCSLWLSEFFSGYHSHEPCDASVLRWRWRSY